MSFAVTAKISSRITSFGFQLRNEKRMLTRRVNTFARLENQLTDHFTRRQPDYIYKAFVALYELEPALLRSRPRTVSDFCPESRRQKVHTHGFCQHSLSLPIPRNWPGFYLDGEFLGFRDPHFAIRDAAPRNTFEGDSWLSWLTDNSSLQSAWHIHPRAKRCGHTRNDQDRHQMLLGAELRLFDTPVINVQIPSFQDKILGTSLAQQITFNLG